MAPMTAAVPMIAMGAAAAEVGVRAVGAVAAGADIPLTLHFPPPLLPLPFPSPQII